MDIHAKAFDAGYPPSVGAVQGLLESPAPIGPQPVGGTLQDIGYAGSRVTLRDGIGRKLLAPIPERLQFDFVIAAPYTPHPEIRQRQARCPRDLLRSDIKRRVLAQKYRPVALV